MVIDDVVFLEKLLHDNDAQTTATPSNQSIIIRVETVLPTIYLPGPGKSSHYEAFCTTIARSVGLLMAIYTLHTRIKKKTNC